VRKRDIYNAERAQGKTYQEIADMFGVTRQTVHRCVNYISHERPGDRWPRLLLWMEQNGINNTRIETSNSEGVLSSLLFFVFKSVATVKRRPLPFLPRGSVSSAQRIVYHLSYTLNLYFPSPLHTCCVDIG
jgi:hypothetical protein